MNGFPNNFHELVQQLGRVNRKGTTKPDENTYEIPVDFNSYVSLYVRKWTATSADERMTQLTQLHKALKFLLLPEVCHHVATKIKFEWTTGAAKRVRALLQKVQRRRGEVREASQQKRATALLTTKVQGAAGKASVSEFMEAMKRERKTIFHRDDVSTMNNQSQMQGVCLQIIVRGLLALKIRDPKKAGTDKLSRAGLCVTCSDKSWTMDRNTLWVPAYMRDECWKRFNLNSN